jgi:Tfp pilus assembly protein PilE
MKKGFTTIEMFLVVAIVLTLLAIMFPVFQEAARRAHVRPPIVSTQ